MEVDHKCKNTKCVNPDHLQAITKIENLRQRRHLKLSIGLAEKIRNLYSKLNQYELADMFKIHQSQVSKIITGKQWRKENACQ